MISYHDFKTIFQNRKTDNRTIKELISELSIETLSYCNIDTINDILNVILSAEDKTTADIDALYSKFNNVKEQELDITRHIICNNKKHGFNLSTDQIMYILEKSDLTSQSNYGATLPMYVLFNNKDQNLNLSTNQIMNTIKKNQPFCTRC